MNNPIKGFKEALYLWEELLKQLIEIDNLNEAESENCITANLRRFRSFENTIYCLSISKLIIKNSNYLFIKKKL